MRETFDKELVQLHVRFAEMGMLVNEAIFRTVKAFVDHDQELAKMVIQNDQAINQCENQLEKNDFGNHSFVPTSYLGFA